MPFLSPATPTGNMTNLFPSLFLLLFLLLLQQFSTNHSAANGLQCIVSTKSGQVSEKTCDEPRSEAVNSCFVVWENISGTLTVLKGGCYERQNEHTMSPNRCSTTDCIANRKNVHQDLKMITFFCCCETDYCNREFSIQMEEQEIPTTVKPRPPEDPAWLTGLMIVLPIVAIAIMVLLVYWFCRRIHYQRLLRKQAESNELLQNVHPRNGHLPSNGGQPSYKPIQLSRVVARGRFGEVWEGQLGSDSVAVKVFPPQDVDSWMQEQEIYAVNGLRQHENILQFICAEERGQGLRSEYWLVTQYHPHGSLHDYLKKHTLSVDECLHIMTSMLRGLAFLHEDYVERGREEMGKPTIVHRDMKSRNVLLKSDLTACIADFGYAIKCYHGQTPEDTHGQVGTRRYMAPEVLEGATEFTAFAFRQIDVYATALVIWECLSRTKLTKNHVVGDFKVPFEEEAGNHPSLSEMQSLVVVNHKRPQIPDSWKNHPDMGTVVVVTMEEMWDREPEARITGGCALERLLQLTTAVAAASSSAASTSSSSSSSKNHSSSITNPPRHHPYSPNINNNHQVDPSSNNNNNNHAQKNGGPVYNKNSYNNNNNNMSNNGGIYNINDNNNIATPMSSALSTMASLSMSTSNSTQPLLQHQQHQSNNNNQSSQRFLPV